MTKIPDAAVVRGKRKEIDPDTLNEIFNYDADTGILYHKKRSEHLFSNTIARTRETNAKWWNGRFAGKKACKSDCRNGYMRVSIFGTEYPSHRIIWAMTRGVWPNNTIDHIDGDKENNRIENLREATTSQNNMNRKGSGKSQYKGVSWRKSQGKWVASIKSNKKQHFLGLFNDEKEAARAYDSAAIIQHGLYAKTNFPQADFEHRVRECINQTTKPVDVAAVLEGVNEKEEFEIDKLRYRAFHTNSVADRQAYFDAVSKWFQDRHYRRMDAECALSAEPAQGDQWSSDIDNAPSDTIILMAWKDTLSGDWQYHAGLYHSTKGGWRHGSATHWMPLPAAPTTEAGR